MHIRATAVCAALGGLLPACALAQEHDEFLFRNPSFEELAGTVVTSVSDVPVSQFEAPAAVYVLTAQEVRAMGSRNIPDALRFAPGIHVAQFDSHTWAIAARGFSTLFVDKLLVLIDGRSVYTPLWSGVYWEEHGWLHPDLDRIEVILGPGGSTWGANAVNGVINVVGKPAKATQGLALEAGGGSEERAFGSVRYGGTLGDDGHYRVYAGYQQRDDVVLGDGRAAGDDWNIARGGIRYDRESENSQLMLKGEVHSGDFGEAKPRAALNPPYFAPSDDGSSSGGYVQTTWSRQFANDAELRLAGWLDHYRRRLAPSNEESDTFDLELQYRFAVGAHGIVAKTGYRRIHHQGFPDEVWSLSPAEREFDAWSASLQDDIALSRKTTLTAGARIEHHDFSGWEFQPNLRLSWRPDERQIFWASFGRAVRTPTISEEGVRWISRILPPGASGPGSPPTIIRVAGRPGAESEELTAWEAGWRHRWGSEASISASAFYNEYDELVRYPAEPIDTLSAPGYWLSTVMPANLGSGHSYGMELTALWLPTPDLQFAAELTYLNLSLGPEGDRLAAEQNGASPRWQASLRSTYSLDEHWQIGASVRYVDELDSLDVRSFTSIDLRIARRFGDELEVALVGRDLWRESRHAEFRSVNFPIDTFIERSVYVTLSWRL